jgi:hypothetical protein
MSARTSSAILFWLCFLIFAELLSWETASWPGPCLIQEAADHDSQNPCPTFLVGLGILIERLDGFIERHDKSIVVAFTVVLAVSTIGLWFATVRLWGAGERQLQLVQQYTAEQSRDMRASMAVADAAAKAAQKSAEVAESALLSTERAFVFLKFAYAYPIIEYSAAEHIDRIVAVRTELGHPTSL